MNRQTVSLAIAMSLATIGTSIPNVALPSLVYEFSVSVSESQWVILAYLLSTTVLIVSIGRLADRLGRRRVFLVGTALYSVGALICGIAPTLSIVIAGRIVQGIGAAALTALSIALISEVTSEKTSGRAMGLLGTMSAIGTASGPTIGGLLISTFGWRWIFLSMSAFGFLNFVLSYRSLPTEVNKSLSGYKGFDELGSILLALSLTSYALAMTLNETLSYRSIVLLAVACVAVTLFTMTENKTSTPLVDFKKLRSSGLATPMVINALVSTVMMSILIVGPFYLSLALGLNAAQVGLVMSIGPLVSVICGVPAGIIVDRGRPSLLVLFGLLQMLIGVISLSVLPPTLGLLGFIISIALLSPGYQLFQAANNTDVMKRVESEERGSISGLLNLSRNLGLITGASLMGSIFAFVSGNVKKTDASPQVVEMGMQATFLFAAGLVALALLLAYKTRFRQSTNLDSK